MNIHKIAFGSRHFSTPRISGKASLDARLDRVFQMAENVDARCVHMFGTATHRRRIAAV